MRAVRRLSRGLGVRTIYLATDSPSVVQQAAEYPEYEWLHYEEAISFSTKANPKDQKWDFVLKNNKERSASGESDNPNMRIATLTTLDVYMLSQCDLFVGKFSSNFFRAAYELKAASCDCAAPFESLDHAWCFDWLENVGGVGTNRTFTC